MKDDFGLESVVQMIKSCFCVEILIMLLLLLIIKIFDFAIKKIIKLTTVHVVISLLRYPKI